MQKINKSNLEKISGGFIAEKILVKYGENFISLKNFVEMYKSDNFSDNIVKLFLDIADKKYVYSVFSDDDINGIGASKLVASDIETYEDALLIENWVNSTGFMN